MSGIVGLVDKNKSLTKTKQIDLMIEKIAHRGKGQCLYNDKTIILGERFLKKKTKVYTQENLVIILDGQLFNREDLNKELGINTEIDEKIIAAAYKKWGEETPKYLRGNFTFIIWDKEEESLYAARDHFGVKPFYYYNGDEFLFASEIKAILAYPNFKKELNKDIIGLYLTFNFNPCAETFFKNIFTLEPAHYLIYKDGKLNVVRYFIPEFNEKNINKEDVTKQINQTINDSVEKALSDEKKIGSFLSSGIDSSYLASIAKPENTFTVGYEEERYSEISYAKELSEKLNIKNNARIIKKEEYLLPIAKIMYHLDEPLADPSTIALYFGAEAASEKSDLIICGEGADEFFGGYEIYQDSLRFPLYSKIPFFVRKIVSKIVRCLPEFKGSGVFIRRGMKIEEWYEGIDWLYSEKELLGYLKYQSNITKADIRNKFYADYKEASELNKMLAFDMNFILVKNFFANVDRLSTMNGMDYRLPFVDLNVFEVARTLPFKGKVNLETTKPYLREAAKTVVPNESYKKKKLPFPVPLRDWIKSDEFYNEIKSTLETKEAEEFFHTKKIIKLLDDHKNGKADNYKKVWAVYVFLIWYKKYFGEE